MIETHTDGTLWVKCSKEKPMSGKSTSIDGKRVRIYHPDARVDRTSHDGGDDYYICPNCNDSWWVEYDG